jgi:hypothetical protein
MDPQEKGRFEVGLSYFHSRRDTVGYRYGYMTAILLGIISFLIVFSIFQLLPPLGTIHSEQFLKNYLLWLALPFISLLIIADVFGPSATKNYLNLALLLIAGLMIYISMPDAIAPFWTALGFFLTITSILGAVGRWWITGPVKDRLQRYAPDWKGTYRAPAIYYEFVLAYVILAGIIGVLIISFG